MSDIIKYLEIRRCGLFHEQHFRRVVTYSMNAKFNESNLCLRSRERFEDVDILHNRLLAIDTVGDVNAYDVSPQADFTTSLNNFPVAATWINDPTTRKHPLSQCCVQWGESGLFFTVSGKKNTLTTVDGIEFVEREKISIPLAYYTTMHMARPTQEHCIAVATSLKSIALIDLKTGAVSLAGLCGHTRSVKALTWSKTDPACILTASNSEVLLWDLRIPSSPLQVQILISDDVVPELRFVDRTKVLILCDKGRILLWDLFRQRILREINGLDLERTNRRCKFFVEDISKPMLLYTPARKNVEVINLDTGDVLTKIGNHMDLVRIVVGNDRTKEVYTFSSYEGQIWRPSIYS